MEWKVKDCTLFDKLRKEIIREDLGNTHLNNKIQ